MVRHVVAWGLAGALFAGAELSRAAVPPASPRPLPRNTESSDGAVAVDARRDPARAASSSTAPPVVSSLPEEVVHGGGAPTFGTPGTFSFGVSAQDAKRMAGGFADPTRFLQTLPGVSNDSDFDGLLYVRGGEGGHNKILLDQVSVSDAYHFGGVISVLNTDVMERVEFMPGGYTAEYGDALAGVLKVRRRVGNPFAVQGSASLSLLTANGTFEGPLGNDGKGSWLVAARRSYVDQILKGRSEGPSALPTYWDVDARLFRRAGGNEFRAGLLRSGDALSARLSDSFTFAPAESSGLTWERQLTLASLEWERTVGGSGDGAWALTGSTAYGWRDQAVLYVSSLPQSAVADTRTFDLRLDAKKKGGPVRWATGVQVTHSHSDYALDINRLSVLEPDRRSNPRSPLDTAHVLSAHEARNVYAATYAQGEVKLADSTVALTLGARLEHSSRSRETLPTPRLRAAWSTPLRGVTVTAAAGSYRQFPADRLETDPAIGNPRLRAERADHYMAGVARTFEGGGRLSVEGYWKRLSNLIAYDPEASAAGTPPFVNQGRGTARGVEFLAHLPRRSFDAWVAYTLGEVEYRDFEGAAPYAPSQDIRHTISAVGRVRPGRGWTLGFKWRAQSGRPYTPVVGRTDVSEFVDGIDWIPVLGGYNSGRFPWYQRLDVRAERSFRMGGTSVNASLEAVNVLGRRNLYDYRYLDGYARAEPVTMLPFLPTFGVTVAF
jgi:hypothetical protein